MASADILAHLEDQNLAHFVSLKGTSLYGVYDPTATTLGRMVDTLHENYSCNQWAKDKFALYSDDLKRFVGDEDLKKGAVELKLGRVSRFILRYLPLHGYTYPEGTQKVENIDEIVRRVSAHPDRYRITVKTLMGTAPVIEVCPDVTGMELKYLINRVEKVPADQLRLIFASKQVDDTKTLKEQGIVADVTVFLCLRLAGGMTREVSGRAGNYEPLKSSVFTIEPDLEKAGVSSEGGSPTSGADTV